MSLYKHLATEEIRDLPDMLIAELAEAGNPKASLWEPYVPPEPIPVTYTREDYKSALDTMLLAQCRGYEFEGVQTLALYLIGAANKFQARAQWLAGLNIFTWATSDEMASQPTTDTPPTPEQLAAYILGLYEANNPRPV